MMKAASSDSDAKSWRVRSAETVLELCLNDYVQGASGNVVVFNTTAFYTNNYKNEYFTPVNNRSCFCLPVQLFLLAQCIFHACIYYGK